MLCKEFLAAGAIMAAVLVQSGGAQQQGAVRQAATPRQSGDWPLYRHDPAGTGYSPLTQITTENVGNLTQVWTYRLQSDAPAPTAAGRGRGRGGGGANSEAAPIVVNGVMYLPVVGRVRT